MRKLSKTSQAGSDRTAFTLVELLLVVSIIAILASLAVGVMAQAQNDAAESATRSRISVIQKILEIELENYEVRRSPIPLSSIAVIAADINWPQVQNLPDGSTRSLAGLNIRNVRRMLIADLIRCEMPDGTETFHGYFPSLSLKADFLNRGVSLANINALEAIAATNQVDRWRRQNVDPFVDDYDNPSPCDPGVDDSEILFLLLSQIDVDGEPAIESIGPRAIGDPDGDGRNDIVDGWGDPLLLRYHQENVVETAPGIWEDSSGQFPFTDFMTIKPVQVHQIRPYLTSERLLEIEGGVPADFNGASIVFP